MSEQLPEQPGLPIFEDEQVSYSVVHEKDTEESDRWESVSLPASEIDNIPDARLRQALWSQLKHRIDPNQRQTIFALANSDHSYRHSYSVSTKPIGLVFTSEGAFNNWEEAAQATEEAKAVTESQHKSAGLFRSVLRRLVR